MAFTERLLIMIDAQTGGAVREVRKVDTEMTRMGTAAGRAEGLIGALSARAGVSAGAIKAGLGVAAFAAGTALVNFGRSAVNAASNLEVAGAAVDAVFGDARDAIDEFAETSARAAGLSERAVLEMAAKVGALLKGMGLSSQQAADSVVVLEQRAADLAATFGGPTEQALTAIAALFRGERDPIEKYGVSLKQVDIDARIAALGLDTSTASAKKQASAIASLQLLVENTADAEGQFARRSGSLAGQQAILNAELENLKATIGEGLVPAMVGLVGLANDLIGPLGDIVGALQKVNEEMGILGAEARKTEDEGGFLGRLVTAAKRFTGAAAVDELREMEDAAAEADSATDGAAEALAHLDLGASNAAKSIADLNKELDTIEGAFFSAKDAEDKYLETIENIDDATADLARAKLELADAHKEEAAAQADATREVERAQRALQSALFDVERTQQRATEAGRDVRDAQREYTEAVRDYGPNSKAAKDAAEELQDAQFGLKEANWAAGDAALDVRDAQEELREKQEDAIRTSDRVAEATERVRTAEELLRDEQDKLVGSTFDVEEAWRKERDVLLENEEAAGRFLGRLNEIKSRHPEIAAAIDDLIARYDDAIGKAKEFEQEAGFPAQRAAAGFLTGATAPAELQAKQAANVTNNYYIQGNLDRETAEDIAWKQRNGVVKVV